jgi:hypothetical protein
MDMLSLLHLAEGELGPVRFLCHKSTELYLVKRLTPILCRNAGFIIRRRVEFGLTTLAQLESFSISVRNLNELHAALLIQLPRVVIVLTSLRPRVWQSKIPFCGLSRWLTYHLHSAMFPLAGQAMA